MANYGVSILSSSQLIWLSITEGIRSVELNDVFPRLNKLTILKQKNYPVMHLQSFVYFTTLFYF